MEKLYRVVFNRKECVGAAACAAIAPEFWEMKEDGKAHLIGCKMDKDGNEILVIKESQMTKSMKSALKLNKDAAEVCPVNVIHVFEEGTDKKLI